MKTKKKSAQPKLVLPGALPPDITEDLLHQDYDNPSKYKGVPWEQRWFELWFVDGWGWCIPTLLISNAGSRRVNSTGAGATKRTYAVRVDNRETVRIGLGPHVKGTYTVNVTKKSLPAMEKYFTLIQEGQTKAGQIRDTISTRRAQGAMRRRLW